MAQIVASIEYGNRSTPRRSSRRHAGAAGRFAAVSFDQGDRRIPGSGRALQSETKPPVDTTIIVQVMAAAAISPRSRCGQSLAPLHLIYAGITEIRKELVASTPQL